SSRRTLLGGLAASSLAAVARAAAKSGPFVPPPAASAVTPFSVRIYWENYPASFAGGRIDIPVGASVFPKEIYCAPRSWAEVVYPKLIHWKELPKGGHFAALEQPELFISEIRECFSKIR